MTGAERRRCYTATHWADYMEWCRERAHDIYAHACHEIGRGRIEHGRAMMYWVGHWHLRANRCGRVLDLLHERGSGAQP